MGTASSKNNRKPSSEQLRNEVGDTLWTMGRIWDFVLNMMGDYWNMWRRERKYVIRFVLKIDRQQSQYFGAKCPTLNILDDDNLSVDTAAIGFSDAVPRGPQMWFPGAEP